MTQDVKVRVIKVEAYRYLFHFCNVAVFVQ